MLPPKHSLRRRYYDLHARFRTTSQILWGENQSVSWQQRHLQACGISRYPSQTGATSQVLRSWSPPPKWSDRTLDSRSDRKGANNDAARLHALAPRVPGPTVFALNYLCWLHNHTPSQTHGWAPLKLFCGSRIDCQHLQCARVWGCVRLCRMARRFPSGPLALV